MFKGELSFEEAFHMPRRELLIRAEIRADALAKDPSYNTGKELNKMM
ncbi:MAG: hypothetical protein ACRC0G_07735 [Fusobacteriaceae bacterium]